MDIRARGCRMPPPPWNQPESNKSKILCIHVKYTCYTPSNGLVVLETLKNSYIDSSHNSVASEIKVLFLLLVLKNDPSLKNGTLKLFLTNFWP